MRKLLIALLLLAVLLLDIALAGEAREITQSCKIVIQECKGSPSYMLDRNRRSTTSDWGKKEFILNITPADTPAAAIYIEFGKISLPFRIESRDEKGNWQTIAEYAENIYAETYVGFEPQKDLFRLVFYPQNGKRELAIRELFVLSEGEVGNKYNHVWQAPFEKADLMVLATHPDDEILWLGGTIPYYAGERGMKVEVCYMTCTDFYRHLELLNGLWQMGVRNYPDIGDFFDMKFDTVKEVFDVWRRSTTEQYIVRLLRRYQPEVLVTQDIKGEYGHSQHIACVQAAIQAVEMAADPNYDAESAAQYGAWEVKKVYIHLGDHPTITMDWTRPLEAFGGKCGLEVAEIAYQCHDSQMLTPFEVAYPGTEYDSTQFTLLRSTVGVDIECNDFFENIPNECLSVNK